MNLILKKNCYFLFVVCSLIINKTFGQSENIKKNYILYYDYLASNGGTWHAFNPDFKPENKNSFKDFVMKFKVIDSLGIRGEIYGITTKKDTVSYWSIYEFFSKNKNKSVLIQRSVNGNLYAIGEQAIVRDNELIGTIEYYLPDGKIQKQKTVILQFGKDKMRFTSYNYDNNGEPTFLGTLVWERYYKNLYDDKFAIKIPNSNRILFVSNKDGDDEIYSMDSDGKNVKQLTNNEDKDFLPAISPNGLEIVFTSQRDLKDELYKMNIDGSNQIRITNNDRLNNEANWSPDGKKIAFLSQPKLHTPPCLFIMNSDGTGRIKATKSDGLVESFPCWSNLVNTFLIPKEMIMAEIQTLMYMKLLQEKHFQQL